MSAELAAQARSAMKSKAERMAAGSKGPVDASGWTPSEPLNGSIQTGERPVSRRQFKTGGAVAGAAPAANAGRAPRANGGKALTANTYVNRDVKDANEERDGTKHIGGFACGGGVYAKGGTVTRDGIGQVRMGNRTSLSLDGSIQGTRPTGGRIARASGGRAKPKTNINIVINTKPDEKPEMAMPPPPPPPPPMPMLPMGLKPPGPPMPLPSIGGPPPMGAPPVARKMGGSVHTNDKPDGGAGGGLGRLEKIKLQRKAACG